MSDFRQLAQDIGSAPLGDLIAAIGRGVAEAQAALDAGSLEQTLKLYDESDDLVQTLRELGYRPTFYTIPEIEGELKLSLTVAGQLPTRSTAPEPDVPITPSARSSLARVAPRPRVYAAPVDGRYQNSFSFTGEVSATVKFKVVAVPPPSEAEQARVAPDFIGTSYADALTLADSFDLGLVVEGGTEPAADDTIETQDVAAGTIVVAGSTITISV